MFSKSSTVRRSVRETTLNSRMVLSIRPAGTSTFCERSACSTSSGVSPKAPSWFLSSQIRIAYLRSPKIRTSAAPGSVCSRGLTMRFATSETSSADRFSLEKAIHTTGLASASTFATTGSMMSSGSLERARATRSRTSAAAPSGSRSSRKRTVIWLSSAREIEVSTSTPSMPAIEFSSGLLTCDSMISADAPRYSVRTVTTGSSIWGYSRTCSRSKLTAPTSIMMIARTVAKTGRWMQVWDRRIDGAPASAGGCRGGRRRDDRVHPRVLPPQLQVAGHDDAVTRREAGDDLDQAGGPAPGLHDDATGAIAVHQEHMGFVGADDQGLLGNDDRLRGLARDQRRAREHPRAQLRVVGLEPPAHQQGPAARVDLRIQGHQPGLQARLRIGIEGEKDQLSLLDLAEEALRQAQVDLHRGQVLDADQVGAGLDVVADAGLAQAEHTVERRPDPGLAQPRLRELELRLQHPHRRLGLVERPGADEALVGELARALHVGFREIELGAGLLHLGADDGRIQRDQQVAGTHRLAVPEMDPVDAAGDLGPEHHGLGRPQGADRRDLVAHQAVARRGDLDIDRRLGPDDGS